MLLIYTKTPKSALLKYRFHDFLTASALIWMNYLLSFDNEHPQVESEERGSKLVTKGFLYLLYLPSHAQE